MATAAAGRNEAITDFTVTFTNVPEGILQEFTIKELNLTESLLTPGLQTSILVDNFRQHIPLDSNGNPIAAGKIPKSLEPFKGSVATITISKPILERFGLPTDLKVVQRVYRLADRKGKDFNNEELVIYCCDDTLLRDAKVLVNKSWKCTTPSSIVSDVLKNCVGAKSMDIEKSGPARNFIAENIHPFQVCTQQGEVALASNDDPSFCHFMTYENFSEGDPRGKHHFRSLHKMAKQKTTATFFDSEISDNGNRLAIPQAILFHEFPADFDLLSDILNGVGEESNSLITFNPFTKIVSMFGNSSSGCGVGGLNLKESMSNQGAPNLNGCNNNVEKYLLKRQARMSLLNNENLATRIVVPWNPTLHVGQTIQIELMNKLDEDKRNYGTGTYLIAAMTHNIKLGGMATTTMDCVSNTVSKGEL
jgi:hypothetical protein